MTVTEHLMRPGTWSLRFGRDVPVSITDQIADAMEGAGGAGCHIVVTPVPVDPAGVAVADVLAAASYTGRVTRRPSRLSIEGVGILDWLNTSPVTAISRTAGTPSQWVGDLAANGITAGTVTNTGATNVTRTFPAHLATRRELLDTIASAGSFEYAVRPDFTIDAAITETLFTSHDDPELVVTRKEEGPSGSLRGVDGGMLDQALDDSKLATKVVVLAEGQGAAIATGEATQALTLKTWNGSTPDLTEVVSSPATPDGDANGTATATLNLRGPRREVKVSSRTYALHRFARPGDYVWLYDPTTGLYDTTNQVQFRGETIAPAKVRLLSWTWPIEQGLGVYLLLNGVTPELVDLTSWVEWEQGDTFWTVGDWNPPSFGRTNRTNPEVEQRIAEGDMSMARLRLTALDDASTTSTGHPAQIGPSTAKNLRIDTDEIQAVNNGAASPLYVNLHGGDVATGEEGAFTNGQGEGIKFSQLGQSTKLVRGAVDHLTIDGDGIELLRSGNGIRDDGGFQFLTTAVSSTEHWTVRGGSASVTTDANGKATITFGATFAVAPFVVCSQLVDTGVQRVVHPTAISTTNCTVVVTVNNAVEASVTRTVQWIAFGRI